MILRVMFACSTQLPNNAFAWISWQNSGQVQMLANVMVTSPELLRSMHGVSSSLSYMLKVCHAKAIDLPLIGRGKYL